MAGSPVQGGSSKQRGDPLARDTEELSDRVHGAPDAPAGFTYGRHAAIVTVRNGQAVTADQVFTS